MPLVNMQDMLAHAYQHKYAVGAFDLVSLDFLEAIVQGAQNRRAPVILSLAESHDACRTVDRQPRPATRHGGRQTISGRGWRSSLP